MTSRTMAWGLGGLVMSLVACSGQNLHDVGDLDAGGKAGKPPVTTPGDAGSPDQGGNGGSFGGGGGIPVTAGIAGYGGSLGGSGGSVDHGGNGPNCFGDFSLYGPDPTDLGPDNATLSALHVAKMDAQNYENQFIFPSGSTWEMNANFPSVSETVRNDTTLMLPSELSKIKANFGEVFIVHPSWCSSTSAAGHKVSVELYWKLHGTTGPFPTHGLALGAAHGSKRNWFDDATRAFVIGDAEATRALNTLDSVKLEHTFAADDTTNVGDIVLSTWLLDDSPYSTTLYVGNVKWD